MIIWTVLIVAAYLLGSVPVSYLAARSRGIDLRQHGTGQVGGGNLWRTTSRRLGLLAGIFDFLKGMAMIAVAWSQGLDVAQQLAVGLAVIVGHNWPVFLRFHGGRGIATTLGILIIIPLLNREMSPWVSASAVVIFLAGVAIMRRTPVPVLASLVAPPIASAALQEPLPTTLGFLALLLVIVIKRLTAQPLGKAITISRGQLILNRLLFDRDIRDRKIWVSRKPLRHQEPEENWVEDIILEPKQEDANEESSRGRRGRDAIQRPPGQDGH
jgi:glycerol-3-phosphate acyltransferase PlsY